MDAVRLTRIGEYMGQGLQLPRKRHLNMYSFNEGLELIECTETSSESMFAQTNSIRDCCTRQRLTSFQYFNIKNCVSMSDTVKSMPQR